MTERRRRAHLSGVTTHLLPSEYERLVAEARAAGVSVSAYVRDVLVGAVGRVADEGGLTDGSGEGRVTEDAVRPVADRLRSLAAGRPWSGADEEWVRRVLPSLAALVSLVPEVVWLLETRVRTGPAGRGAGLERAPGQAD